MTIPLAAVGMGLQIASAGAAIAGQIAQANAQSKFNAQQAGAIRAKAASDYAALDARAIEDRENASDALNQNDKQLRSAVATAETAAGEGGVSGVSVDALLRDLYGQAAAGESRVTVNLDRSQAQMERERLGIQQGASSSLGSLSPVERPDYLGTAIRLGSGLYGTYNDHLKIREGDL